MRRWTSILLGLALGALTQPFPAVAREGKIIAIDPGHGGPEPGAVAGDLVERDVNLGIALDVGELLREEGFGVVFTRSTTEAVNPDYVRAPDRPQQRRDLQMRVEIANAARAQLFLSIHNNGSPNPAERGTEIWYDASRPFSDRNLLLAELALDGIVNRLRAAGYDGHDRGVRDDARFKVFRGRAFPLFVLGPGNTSFRSYEPSGMPGILGESLFLTNAGDAAALRRSATLHAIALGYRDAVVDYFRQVG